MNMTLTLFHIKCIDLSEEPLPSYLTLMLKLDVGDPSEAPMGFCGAKWRHVLKDGTLRSPHYENHKCD
jgi:hypothetical protein